MPTAFDFSNGLLTAPPIDTTPLTKVLIFTGPSSYGAHMLETFSQCPQLFAYYNLIGLDLGEVTTPLVRGTLLHVGLAHFYARRGAKQKGGLVYEGVRYTDMEAFYTPIEAIKLVAGRLEDPRERSAAATLLPMVTEQVEAYMKWAGPRDTFQIVAVEEIHDLSVYGFPYTGRTDLVVGSPQGIYIWDHKGAARVDRVHPIYSMSLQVNGLKRLGRERYGSKFRGVLLNYVGATAPYKVERREPEPAPAFEGRVPQIIVDAWLHIKSLMQSGRDPWNWPVHPTNCLDSRWGNKRCPAFEFCQLGKPPQGVVANPNPAVLRVLAQVMGG